MLELGAFNSPKSKPRYSVEARHATLSIAARRDPVNIIADASVLRGVPASKLLRGGGALLKSPTTGWQYQLSDSDAEELYNTSEEVQHLDWFISHSWRSHRALKFMGIIWILHAHTAMLCANVGAALWCASVLFLSYTSWGCLLPIYCKIGSHGNEVCYGMSDIIYGAVFFFILTIVSMPRVVQTFGGPDPTFFLDKACIHQKDAERKRVGINSIGGFLRKSRRLLVFWSSDYFDRLWCNYEIACFASIHGGIKTIDFVPLFLPSLTVLFLVSAIVQRIIHLLQLISSSRRGHPEQIHVLVNEEQQEGNPFVLTIAGNWVQSWKALIFARHVVWGAFFAHASRGRGKMQDQLMNFRLGRASCFCCSVGHKLDDGTVIECDRQFVEGNVGRWFDENVTTADADGIEAFERCVRDYLRMHVSQWYGPLAVPVTAFVPMIMVYLWDGVDKVLYASSQTERYKSLVDHMFSPFITLLSFTLLDIWCRRLFRLTRDWSSKSHFAMDFVMGVVFAGISEVFLGVWWIMLGWVDIRVVSLCGSLCMLFWLYLWRTL